MMGTRVQVSAVAAAIALTLAIAALALTRGGGQHGESQALQIGAGEGTFTDDSLRLKRERMVARLKGLRGVEGSMREQLATLNSQEHALEHAWQTTEASTDGRRGRHARKTREALSSSIFSPAFPGAQSGLSVCEPWPSCCPSGNADNCYGVVSGGVLGAHACSPYPMCCGLDTHNCFDETSLNMTPDDSSAAPSEVDISHLAAVCEGEEQLKQCLTQTQSCMSPSSEGISADTCTCFSSSLYCSYPQTPESCSPCPMACQQKIYEWFKASQTEMDGTEMLCPLFEKAQANEDISALDDGSFRPYAWFSDKELHPAPKVVATVRTQAVYMFACIDLFILIQPACIFWGLFFFSGAFLGLRVVVSFSLYTPSPRPPLPDDLYLWRRAVRRQFCRGMNRSKPRPSTSSGRPSIVTSTHTSQHLTRTTRSTIGGTRHQPTPAQLTTALATVRGPMRIDPRFCLSCSVAPRHHSTPRTVRVGAQASLRMVVVVCHAERLMCIYVPPAVLPAASADVVQLREP